MKTEILSCDFLDGIHYFVYVMDIPRLSKKETEKLIKFRLKNTYPGNIDNLLFVVKPNGKDLKSRIIIAVEKQYCTHPLKIPTLALCSLAKNKTGNFIYISDSMVECAIFEKGVLKHSVVSFYKTTEELDSTLQQNKNTEFEDYYLDLRENRNVFLDTQQISIFLKLGKNRKIRNALIFSFFILMSIGCLVVFSRQQKNLMEQTMQKKKEEAFIQAQRKEEKEMIAKLQNLEQQWEESKKNIVIAPSDILTQLFISFPSGTKIDSLQVRNNSFRFEASYKDSLIVLSNMRENDYFYDVQLHQVKPFDKLEKFTITGFMVEPYNSKPEETLSTIEKINILENYINIATQYENDGFSVSSLGALIKKLLEKNKCILESYQCLRNRDINELEFSIRASSYNFFKFLFSISQNNYYFSIPTITIRSNKNELDIIFKISAGKDAQNDIFSTDFIPYSIPEDFLLQIASFWKDKAVQKTVKPVFLEQSFLPVPSWIRYIGIINRENNSYVFLKDEKNGIYSKIPLGGNKNPYAEIDGKEIIIYHDKNKYKMRTQ